MNTLLHIPCRRHIFFMCLLVDVFLWCLLLWKEIVVRILNVVIWIITRWIYQLPHLSITLTDIGFFKAHDIIVKWDNNVILNAEAITVKVELNDWRCISIKVLVTNLCRVADTFEALFSFILYWRVFPLHSTSTGLENNSEIDNYCVRPKISRLQATSGKIMLKFRENGQAKKGSAKIGIKVKAAEVVFTSGMDIFIVNGRANKITCDIKGRRRNSFNCREHLIEMSCLRLKLVFPKDSDPDQLSFRFQGTRVRITRNTLKSLLWTLNEFKSILAGNDDRQCDNQKVSESTVSSFNNLQLSKVKIFAEDLVLSLGTPHVPEIAAIKVFLDITANNWIGKTHCNGTVGLQGLSISDVTAVDPCIIIGNDLITASWRCTLNITHVYKRCLIFNAESQEILSMIVRPDYYEVLLQLKQHYSFLVDSEVKTKPSELGEAIKIAMEEYCPRTQISTAIEGLHVCLELDVFEKLVSCSLEDIRFQCTRDSENLSCDFTVKVIEVEDRINNELVLRQSADGDQQTRSIHVTVVQEATNEKRSVSFQQLYGGLADFTISVQEELLLKLLLFCRITSKSQVWGEQEPTKRQSSLSPNLPVDGSPQSFSTIDDGISLFFERLEMTCVNVVCCLCPKQELSEELVQLKENLGIPNGLPPCLENARLDFESFLRKGIYYRSFNALFRDLKRHYLKEVGRQSAKILGSLHLLGNVTELKDNIAEGLAELKDTGDYMGFVGHVRNGLADSYYKIADSWSAYVRTPTKIPKSSEKCAPKSLEDQRIDDFKEEKAIAQPRLLSSLSSSLSGWVFRSPSSESLPQQELRPVSPEESSMSGHTPPPHDSRPMCDFATQEEDAQSSFSLSSSPTYWNDVSQKTQKQLKGQEFLRRLKESMDDTEIEEQFICCLKLRYSKPKDKLNALITSRKVYLMTVGQPSVDNVVLRVELGKIFQAKPKEEGDVKYLELVMCIDGMQRLSLPSPNPEDSPLVRCDSIHLATKAANKINKAKKLFHTIECCPCSVLLNSVNL